MRATDAAIELLKQLGWVQLGRISQTSHRNRYGGYRFSNGSRRVVLLKNTARFHTMTADGPIDHVKIKLTDLDSIREYAK